MKKNKVSGFTLIELLVVITIIGILAVGGVSVYTQQMAKARDSSRINGVQQLRSAIEQYNSEVSSFPLANAFVGVLRNYMTAMPVDPRAGNGISRCGAATPNQICDFIYANSAAGVDFEVSAAFEHPTNITNKAAADGGNSNNRYEVFSSATANLVTDLNAYAAANGITVTTGANDDCIPTNATTPLVIRSNCN